MGSGDGDLDELDAEDMEGRRVSIEISCARVFVRAV